MRLVLRDLLVERFPELRQGCIGFYWPFKGEIDRHLVREVVALGAVAALPVVVQKRQPLEFWAWRLRMKLARGIWNIPIPAEPNAVRPTALLVPVLGFDGAGYRLGYGGGYYDRTLAIMNPKPLTIGVGYALGRLPTIHPQPHDILLDAIMTEAGFAPLRDRLPLSDPTTTNPTVPPLPHRHVSCTDSTQARPALRNFSRCDDPGWPTLGFRRMEPDPISGTFSPLPHLEDMTMIQPKARATPVPSQSEATALADATLVERVRAGDAGAFELIMRRHNQRLYRLARGIVRSGSEAEDVVQEAYVRACERLGDFIGPNGFSAWLGTIVVNEALGRLRKRGRVISFDEYLKGADGDGDVRRIETMRAPQPDPERLAASGELRRLLENAIDALPDDFRVVFVLRAVEGMGVLETAQYLSIRPETVKTRFHRARRLLQGTLGAQFDALMPCVFAFGGQHCDRIVAAVLARLGPAFRPHRHATHSSKSPPGISPDGPTSTPTSGKED